MKLLVIAIVVVALALLLGCASKTRSISQSGFYDHHHHTGPRSRDLDEFDVLGLDRNKTVTEEDIQRAAHESRRVQLAPSSTLLLIQSGAIYPDGRMVVELSKHFSVVPFTGLADEPAPREARGYERTTRNVAIISDPEKPASVVPLSNMTRETYQTPPPPHDPGAYSRTLRLAAARAGASTVVCYWGVLESGSEEIATKTVTWLPVVNWVVPDEKQHMRISLKVALVDVASGSWSVFSVQPPDSKSWAWKPRREVADQKLVESLKAKAYEMAAADLVRSYGKLSSTR